MTQSTFSLSRLCKRRFPGKKIVLVGGAFDILHPGHITMLEKAKSLGDVLIVHITSDRRFRAKRQRAPLFKERERARIIAALRMVDGVIVFDGRHYDQLLVDKIRPDILFFHEENYRKARQYVEETLKFDGRVFVQRSTKQYSSSRLLQQLRKMK